MTCFQYVCDICECRRLMIPNTFLHNLICNELPWEEIINIYHLKADNVLLSFMWKMWHLVVFTWRLESLGWGISGWFVLIDNQLRLSNLHQPLPAQSYSLSSSYHLSLTWASLLEPLLVQPPHFSEACRGLRTTSGRWWSRWPLCQLWLGRWTTPAHQVRDLELTLVMVHTIVILHGW